MASRTGMQRQPEKTGFQAAFAVGADNKTGSLKTFFQAAFAG